MNLGKFLCALSTLLILSEGKELSNPLPLLTDPVFVAQVLPSSFGFLIPTSVNGSSVTGNCTPHHLFSHYCDDPSTSVLFDGHVPMLSDSDLDGDMWAGELLTFNTTLSSPHLSTIIAEFPGPLLIERLEVVMFNCPEWGISVLEFELQADLDVPPQVFQPNITSCDSLVRVCIELNATSESSFSLDINGSNYVHLAEMRFFVEPGECRPDTQLQGTASV